MGLVLIFHPHGSTGREIWIQFFFTGIIFMVISNTFQKKGKAHQIDFYEI